MKKGFRRCSVCKVIKPLTEFSKQKNVYGEHSRLCLKCSHKLHKEYLQKQNKEVGDFYVSQYGIRKGITEFNPEIIEGLRDEIIESRKPNIFLIIRNFLRFLILQNILKTSTIFQLAQQKKEYLMEQMKMNVLFQKKNIEV